MKKLLSIISFLICISASANTYYVDATNGLNTNSGLSTGAAWQTIVKVNSFAFASGDVVLFKRGETFYGSIVVSRNNISFDAYGSGAQPIITGFQTLTGWTSAGGGVYYITTPAVKSTVNMVAINGIPQEVGRYPNSDAANGGYLTDNSFVSNTQYTCSALTTDWTGAEVVARLRGYLFERNTITSWSAGGIINYARTIGQINTHRGSPQIPTTPPAAGFGLFIQRDIRTLDKFGEWYFNPSSKVFSMFFGAANPASYTVKVSTLDTGFNISTHTTVAIRNLNIEGFNLAGVIANDNSGTTVENCTINNTGCKGVFLWYSSGAYVNNNTITNSMNNAIDIEASPVSTVTVTNNTISNSGMLKGMSQFYDPADCVGLFIGGNSVTRHNYLDSLGYNGVRFEGQNINVDSNLVNHYCQVRNDGGGIYAQNEPAANATVKNNIVINAGNPTQGTQEQVSSNPIYMDNGQGGVTITNNSISGVPGINFSAGFGLFFNSPKNITATGNTIYDGNGWYVGRQAADSMFNFTLSNNIIFTVNTSQLAMLHTHNGLNGTVRYTSTGIQNDLQQLGTINNNYYNTPNSNPFWWYYANTIGGAFVFPPTATFANWKSYTGLDATSTSGNISLAYEFKYNATSTSSVYSFTGFSKKSITGTVYNNSVTIPAWSSIILIDNGSSSVPSPNANAGADKAITLPVNYVTLTGGSTSSAPLTYTWQKIDGPAGDVIFSNRTDTTTITFVLAGTYHYSLTVTNSSNLSTSDTMAVVVSPNPASTMPPTVNAGTDQTIQLPVNSVNLSASTTGNITDVLWRQLTGPSTGVFSTPALLTTAFSTLIQGTYTVELWVKDFNLLTARDTLSITVAAPIANIPPVANAGGNKTITLPTNSVTVTGSGTDVDGTINPAGYLWTVFSGPIGSTNSNPTATTTTIGNLVQGTYTVAFRVTDNVGATGSATMQITVNPAIPPVNTPPVANAGADTTIVLPVSSKTLNGSGTDADGTIASYLWRQVNGPNTGSFSSTTNKNAVFSGMIAGTYNLTLRVTDNSGDTAVDAMQIIVSPAPANTPPTANAGADTVLILPTSNLTMYNTSASDVEGAVTILWTQISGPLTTTITSSTTLNPGVSGLTRTGKYVYNMKVTDGAGAFTNDSKQVTVLDATCNCIITKGGRRKVSN